MTNQPQPVRCRALFSLERSKTMKLNLTKEWFSSHAAKEEGVEIGAGNPELIKLLEKQKPKPTHFHDCTGPNNEVGKITAPQRI